MIITGDLDGKKLRVWQTFPHQEDEEGNPLEHPNGYYVEKIPEYPKPRRGIDDVLYYDIEKKEFFFEETERPLNELELRQEQNEILREILNKLK